jgi:carboxymethylenebutenolidase
MINSTIQFILILIVSSILLPASVLKQEEVYAQNSPRATNATVLSGDGNSQSGLQNKPVNYYGNSSGYLVYPTATSSNTTTQGEQQQKLPAVVMIHEW